MVYNSSNNNNEEVEQEEKNFSFNILKLIRNILLLIF